MTGPSDNIPHPGQEKGPLTRETFTRGLSAVSAVIDSLGAQTLTVENDDMSLYDEAPLDPDQVIGKQAIVTKTTGAISYRIDLRFFNEARGVNPA